MIRVTLGVDALASTRFAISPIHTVGQLLFLFHRRPHLLAPALRRRLQAALRERDLGLVARLMRGSHGGYTPDFMTPRPRSFHADLHTELHHLTTTPAERIGYDMGEFLNGSTVTGAPGVASKPDAVAILNVLDHGETHLAHTLADQLHHLWDAVLAPAWPQLRDRMEADIAQRAATITHDGYITLINQVCPTLTWRDGGLDIDLWRNAPRPDPSHHHTTADTIVFTPSAFAPTSWFCVDAESAPHKQPLTIVYPLLPDSAPAATSAAGLADVIGETRARILAALAAPRTTGQLAQDLHLTAGTISYHLQLLHQAGLVTRARHARQVLYQQRLPADEHMSPAGPPVIAAPGPLADQRD
ncbi:DUF5937 family protein [Actinoallomurus liliacearum]|uniref:DUF5937 family protein n=1 Tax=Actinoallomurus liliacearum TaxID=1080073 RepID=A0ABP8TQS6_9ACTN